MEYDKGLSAALIQNGMGTDRCSFGGMGLNGLVWWLKSDGGLRAVEIMMGGKTDLWKR